MEKKEVNDHRFWIILIAFCVLMIFTVEGFATETNRDSLIAEQNSVMEKYMFSLDLSPIDSYTTKQLHLTPLVMGTSQESEAHPFVLTEVTSSPLSPQTTRAPRKTKLQNSLYTTSLITLTALNIADYFTTVQALKHKELEEGNPVMKPIVKNIYVFTAVKLGIAALDIYFLKNLYKKNKPLAWVLSAAANFAMSYVVANNVKMIGDVR
ncbi:MAG: DUF5658 family protein [Candidatus Aminicenantes bacterium]